jgi:hypothetical protein
LVGTEAAFDALIGYDDDAFSIFEAGDSICARFGVYFDEEAEAREFAEIARFRGGLPAEHSSSTSNTAVQIDVCDPIGDPQNQRFATIFPLIVVNEMTLTHIQGGVDHGVARCAAIEQASGFSATAEPDDFPGWDVLEREASGFIDGCR